MKIIKRLLIVLLLFSLFGCKSKNVYELGDFSIDKDKITIDDTYNLGNKFTISFWIKNDSNYVGSEILSLDSDGEKVTLLNNTEDENGRLTGLVLVHQNGLLYSDNDHYLKLNTYNHVAIEFDKKYFSLYLNGELVNKVAFSKSFRGVNLGLTLGGDNLKCDIEQLRLYNYIDTKELVENVYSNNDDFKIDLNFNEYFLDNAKGKIRLSRLEDVEYSVSDGAYIEDGFLIFEDNDTSEDKLVTLSAYYDGINHDYIFRVRGDNDDTRLLNAYNKAFNNLEYIISESDTFLDNIYGYDISYNVIKGRAKYLDNHFVKDENASEKEKCTIEASVDGLSFQKEIVLLDEYVGYLMAGFTGSAFYPDYVTGDETMFFALSKDLSNWTNVDIKVSANEGSNRLRDSFIDRDKDGNYVLMATQGYMYSEIYIGSSNDLINYDVRLTDVNYYDKDLDIGGNYAWAPEFIYDSYNDLYVLMYSDSERDDSAIYAVTTKDFKSFSYPYVFFDTGYKIIDADITLIDGKYYLFYKDESDRGYGKLYYAVCDNLAYNSTWRIYDEEDDAICIDKSLEGPFALKGINDEYYFYGDAHAFSEIYYGKLLEDNEKLDISLSKLESKEVDGIHHFSIIKLTNKEYERILKKS